MRARQDRLADSLAKIYERIGENQRLVLEYKFFQPALYQMEVPDWGTNYVQVAALGDRAMVCLDTGHHVPSANIEFIPASNLGRFIVLAFRRSRNLVSCSPRPLGCTTLVALMVKLPQIFGRVVEGRNATNRLDCRAAHIGVIGLVQGSPEAYRYKSHPTRQIRLDDPFICGCWYPVCHNGDIAEIGVPIIVILCHSQHLILILVHDLVAVATQIDESPPIFAVRPRQGNAGDVVRRGTAGIQVSGAAENHRGRPALDEIVRSAPAPPP
jgi:hypothetical protein